MLKRRNHDLRRERKRRGDRPGREGSVVGSVWNAAGGVAEESPFARGPASLAGAVAGRDAPASRPVAAKVERVRDGITLVHESHPAAVLEVVPTAGREVSVAEAPEVDPQMRKLVREERPAVKDVQPEEAPEAKGRRPLAKARSRKRVRGRPQGQEVQEERLVVSAVTRHEETALGRPPVREDPPARERPRPVRAPEERPAEGADFALPGSPAVEERDARENSRKEDRRVHRGKLAAKRPPPRAHVEEVVVQAVETGRVFAIPLLAPREEAQGREDAVGRLAAREPAPKDGDRIARQGETHRGHARGRSLTAAVAHEAVAGVRLVHEVAKRVTLELAQFVEIPRPHAFVTRAPRRRSEAPRPESGG